MTHVLTLLLFLFPLAYSPGPGNLFFAANGARFGVWATLPALFGYHLATLIVTGAIGLGFGAAVAHMPATFTIIRWGGAAYVLWLALSLWRAGASHAAQARPAGFWGGVVLLLFNPKAYVIIALMFSQFLTVGSVGQIMWITGVFTLNNLLAFGIYAALGDRLARHLRDAAGFNRALALILAGVALWMLF